MGFGSAPGKVILSGEHSVVYGYPALAAAIGLRCTSKVKDGEEGLVIKAKDMNSSVQYLPSELESVKIGSKVHPKFDNIALATIEAAGDNDINFEIEISSDIPIGAGLGSSAAVSVATIAAVYDLLDVELNLENISHNAYLAEKIAHGNPSGIDNTTATYGGIIRFEDGSITTKSLSEEIPLIIVNTLVPRDTKTLVDKVRSRKSILPASMKDVLDSMGTVTNEIEKTLDDNNYSKMGLLFDINQGLLDSIGVGHPKISSIIWDAKEYGAYGAKLTGAGGGGCLLILAEESVQNEIIKNIREPNIDIIKTNISPHGVKLGEIND